MPIQLSTGALRDIFSISKQGQVQAPITVQVTATKPVFLEKELKKYRVMMTDGVYIAHGLMDEQCMPYVSNNNFTRYCIIQIKQYSVFSTQKHLVLIKDVELLSSEGEKVQQKDFINVDTYFAEHPEDDYLGLSKKSESPAPASFEQPQQPPKQQPQYPPGSAPVGSKPPGRIAPIESLSPYQNQWTIKARVSYKGDLRTWSNAKGEGKLFSVNFLDESDEIKATAFNDVAEKLYKLLEEGKVYYISKARVQTAKKQFNHLSHPYELAFERDTEVTECFDTANVPTLNFSFVKLNQIQNLETNAIVDVIGALKTVNPSFQITAKSTGKAFDRRNVTIVDDTGFAIDVGLWNSTAIDFSIPEGSVVAFKGCKVQEFNGKSLTLTQAGTMVANPETPESYQLKGWYDHQGINENFKSLKVETGSNQVSNRKTIAEAEEENLGKSDRPDYFSIKATIGFTKVDNFCYPACSNESQNQSTQKSGQVNTCNRKLIELNDGSWKCERCDLTFSEPTYRYIFNCSVMDNTGQLWLTLFDQEAHKLFGVDASVLKKYQQDEADGVGKNFTELTSSILFKEYSFRVRARQDNYNDNVRIRYQAVGLDYLDYNQEADALCKELEALLG
ncbi:replication factor-a protein [Suhomyces tanzawaensis NRRL Y-17324]|uniref:Replication protein A subunit n=1 Tax=Suhomyces tanzawaensis NRRL Y-17324 TaxID=984487 RepID=A0A1E4SJI8_9ASCO|nr:replication factor-a protein [Suhomyces tanzawaensis NRRL Y-17324]ODV79658.1 replication factor-a protein [Suhomyces tanzawaensis NRRL Y-17324]